MAWHGMEDVGSGVRVKGVKGWDGMEEWREVE